jgi:hypothetical protein
MDRMKEAPPMPRRFDVEEIAPPDEEATSTDPYRHAPDGRARSTLTIRWRDRRYVPVLGLFTVAWWLATPYLAGAGELIVLYAGAGVALAIVLACELVNRRTVRVDPSGIAWSSEPLKLFAGRRIGAEEVAQLHVAHLVDRALFVVTVRTHRGVDVPVAELTTPDQARWLEQRIEAHLGIVNRAPEAEAS